MKVLVFVALVCALLPSYGEAGPVKDFLLRGLTKRSATSAFKTYYDTNLDKRSATSAFKTYYDTNLDKRSATSAFKIYYDTNLDKRWAPPSFDNLYAILVTADDYDRPYVENEVADFLSGDDVKDFTYRYGISMTQLDNALASSPDIEDDERELVKAMLLLRIAGYDIAALAGDSSSEELDQ